MTADVTQWLTEIKALQQQVADLQVDREAAWQSAAKWRQLYETEAKQRRADSQLNQQTITGLQAELAALRGIPTASAPDQADAIAAAIQGMSPVELQQALIDACQERDRLRQTLQTEQANHAQTRQSLTASLSDAVNQLAQTRQAQSGALARTDADATVTPATANAVPQLPLENAINVPPQPESPPND